MQLTAPAPAATAAATKPTFTGAVEYMGGGLFGTFVATPSSRPYGSSTGYASLEHAIDALQEITVGAAYPAAGIFEADGRFHARALFVEAQYDDQLGGIRGPWLLEQHSSHVPTLGDNGSGFFHVDPALRAIVDGDVVFDPAEFRNG